jgi:hypothetical protein
MVSALMALIWRDSVWLRMWRALAFARTPVHTGHDLVKKALSVDLLERSSESFRWPD